MSFIGRRVLRAVSTRTNHHLCMRATCKHCMSTAIRTFATQTKQKTIPLSSLASPFTQEIQFNQESIKEENNSVSEVLKKHKPLLSTLSIEQGEGGACKLVAKGGEGEEICVEFNSTDVSTSIYEGMHEADDEACEEEDDFDEEDMESSSERDDFEGEVMPFNATVTIKKSSGTLKMMTEIIPAQSPSESPEILLLSAHLKNLAYEPSIESIDEEIRDQMEAYLQSNVGSFVPFIVDFSRARDSELYGEWLEGMKKFVQ